MIALTPDPESLSILDSYLATSCSYAAADRKSTAISQITVFPSRMKRTHMMEVWAFWTPGPSMPPATVVSLVSSVVFIALSAVSHCGIPHMRHIVSPEPLTNRSSNDLR